MDLGGGLAWSDPALGLSAELSARGRIAHEASRIRDRGVSGLFAWGPNPSSERGPSLAATLELGLRASRRESASDDAAPEHGIRLDLVVPF